MQQVDNVKEISSVHISGAEDMVERDVKLIASMTEGDRLVKVVILCDVSYHYIKKLVSGLLDKEALCFVEFDAEKKVKHRIRNQINVQQYSRWRLFC